MIGTRMLDPLPPQHRQKSSRQLKKRIVVEQKRDVITSADEVESQFFQGLYYPFDGSIGGKSARYTKIPVSANEHLLDERESLYDLWAEGLYVKADGRFHVGKGLLIRIALTYHTPFMPKPRDRSV